MGHTTPQNQKQEQQDNQNQDNRKSDGSSSSSSSSKFKKPKLLLIAAVFSGYLFHSIILRPNDLSLGDVPVLLGIVSPPSLNPTSFVPYTIVEREQVSSTAFIITVEPFDPLHRLMGGGSEKKTARKNANKLRNELQEAWHHGLWCVEIKQPQLQVARDYTPLPPPVGQESAEMQRGRLRFLIRKMEGGEVSSYLSKLQVGDKVELRGPHLGFDVARRLLGGSSSLESSSSSSSSSSGHGGGKEQGGRVVFLAGGTGIAPALQVARRLYGPVYEKRNGKKEEEEELWKEIEDMPAIPPKMTIVWANRFREDCPDCEDLEALRKRGYLPPSLNNAKNTAAGGGIMPYLQDIKAHHPEQFNYACTVDTEKKFIDAKTILDAVVSTTPNPKSSSSSTTSLTKSATKPSCPLHSSSALINVSDRQDHEARCKCASHANGKNLLMVSGPDGFIARFAGPKAWSEGLERQGHVAGVAGELMKKGKMNKEEWMVLKL